MAVGADGKVFLCSHDEMSHHLTGDVNKQSIHEIWNGPLLREARQVHKDHLGVKKYTACATCFLPRASVAEATKVGDRTITVNNMVNRANVVGK